MVTKSAEFRVCYIMPQKALFFSQERKKKKDCPLSLKIGVKEILNYRKLRNTKQKMYLET